MAISVSVRTLQVFCINKWPNHIDPHHRIIAIGGIVTGIRWRHSEDAAIQNIERGIVKYYTNVNGKTAWLEVAIHQGRKYLKTDADGYLPNNLLSLPECPK